MIKKEKGVLDLSEIKRIGNRYDWVNSIGTNIKYNLGEEIHNFKIVDYIKEKQRVILNYNDNIYPISTVALINGGFSNIIKELRFKDFKYEIDGIVKTEKKSCKILSRFSNEENKRFYKCECLDCGNVKEVSENYITYKGFTCEYCSDNISYPEKIMFLLLRELNVCYEYQKMFEWSKKVKFKCDDNIKYKIYDFYIPNINTIIEINGELHYEESKWSNSRSLEYVRENDRFKKELAIENGIRTYIVINCRLSNFEYIKENIIRSELSELFNLNSINWDKINKCSYSTLMKDVSNLWNNGMNSSREISEVIGLSKPTVITYLKKMTKIGLCDYDAKTECKKGSSLRRNKNTKKLICLDNGVVFDSIVDCIADKNNLFKEKLLQSKVSLVCNGKRPHHKGYHFKYVSDLTEEEKLKYNII